MATVGVFTAINNSLNTCTITNLNFTDQAGIAHVADLSNIGGSASETGNAVVSHTLQGGTSVNFSVYYTTSTTVGGTYVGDIAVLATLADLTATSDDLRNYIYLQTPAPVVPPPTFSIDYSFGYSNNYGGGDGGGGPGGPGCGPGGSESSSSCSAGASASSGDSGGGGGGGGCFLTTAAVTQLGLPDDCEELTLARYLRDQIMTNEKDSLAKQLYYEIAPVLVERKTDWTDFYNNTLRPMTNLIKNGEYELAIKLYKISTLDLINQYASAYSDKEIIEKIYQAYKGTETKLPYVLKYLFVKSVIHYKLIKGLFLRYVRFQSF